MSTEVFAIAPLTTFEETFEWGTTVIGCRNSESLAPYKEQPVYLATYSFRFRSVEEFEYAKALAERIGLDSCYMPLWHFYALFPALISGTSTIASTLSFIEYPMVEKTFLLFESPDNWEVITIASVSDVNFTFTSPITRDYSKAWLIPLVKGFIQDGVSFSDSIGSSLTAKLTFRAFYRLVPAEFSVTPDYFSEYPVFDLPMQTSTTIEHRFTQAFEMASSDLGLSELLPTESYARQNYSFSVSTHQRIQIKALKDLLCVLQGRAGLFWLPTKTKDIRLKSSDLLSGSVTLITYPTKLPSADRYILLRTLSGNRYLKISVITQIDFTTDHILIDTPPTEDIIGILSVEFLHLVRLNSDSVTISYRGKNLAAIPLTAIGTNKHINALYPPKYILRTTIPMVAGIWTAKDSSHIYIEGEGIIYSFSLSTGLLTPIITGLAHKDPGSGVRFGGIVTDGTFLWELHWDIPQGIAKYTTSGSLVDITVGPMTGVPLMLEYSPYGIFTWTSELGLYRINFSGGVDLSGGLNADTGVSSIFYDGLYLWVAAAVNLYKVSPTTLEILHTTEQLLSFGFRHMAVLNGFLWVTNPNQNSITKISRSSGIILATISLDYTPTFITALSSGFLAVSCQGSGLVLFVNPLTLAVMGSVSTPNPGQVIEGTDHRLYIPNGSANTMSVY